VNKKGTLNILWVFKTNRGQERVSLVLLGVDAGVTAHWCWRVGAPKASSSSSAKTTYGEIFSAQVDRCRHCAHVHFQLTAHI
jgi:hypothetical protein